MRSLILPPQKNANMNLSTKKHLSRVTSPVMFKCVPSHMPFFRDAFLQAYVSLPQLPTSFLSPDSSPCQCVCLRFPT